ncbi:MAG: PA0069 family radical SAM protein [Myxococcales bacterium]|nr:PA0069 family radical SAM protein [Myxococcales bacterium]
MPPTREPDGPSAPAPPQRGRGAVSSPAGRFERWVRVDEDDGWSEAPDERPTPRTLVTWDAARSVLSRNDSPDIPFDRSVNPYRGCEHGCVYCFARPSHAYLGLSPGLDFETRIVAKPDAARLLAEELARPGYAPAPLALGANTDPYQPVERRLGITRGVLEVLAAAAHPVVVVTKSELVLRDLDLLAPMAERGLAAVLVSLTTLEPELARRLEPRAAAPHRRLAAMRRLAEAGVPVGVLTAPMIPGLNDHELERLLAAAHAAGAASAGMVLLRLPHELGALFDEWLAAHYPARRRRVLGLVRDCRAGTLNDPRFGSRMRGAGAYADLLAQRFERARARLGLLPRPRALETRHFRPPTPPLHVRAGAHAGAPADRVGAARDHPTRQLELFPGTRRG